MAGLLVQASTRRTGLGGRIVNRAEPGTVNRERRTDNSTRGRTLDRARLLRARNGNHDANTNSRSDRNGIRDGIRNGSRDGTKLALKVRDCRGRRRPGR